MPLELCVDSDVYNRIGGQAALAQLIDPDGTGTWSADTLALAIQDASNQVASAVGVQSEMSGQTNAELRANFPELVTLTAQKALPLVWLYGTSGRAMPEKIVAIGAMADAELEKIAARRRKSGNPSYSPTPAHRIKTINNDPNLDRMTLASFKKGLC